MTRLGKSSIEYCDYYWNPITGCRHECEYCWARKMATRYDRSFEPAFHSERLDQPFNTKKPGIVFVCNSGDIFSPGVKESWRMKVKGAAAVAPWHTYLWLTKNPQYDDSWVRSNWWLGATITGPEDAWKREVLHGENIWYSYEPLFGMPSTLNLWHAKQVVIGRATNYKSEWCDQWAKQLTWAYQHIGTRAKIFWKNNIGTKGPRELAWNLTTKTTEYKK